MEAVYIYLWADPRTGAKYVGRTKNLKRRKNNHLKRYGNQHKKNAWFKELEDLGLTPEFYVLQEMMGHVYSSKTSLAEAFWIKFYLGEGAEPLNESMPFDANRDFLESIYGPKLIRRQYTYNAETKELSVVKELVA